MSLFENTQNRILPMMTLREVVIFPGAITPLFVGRDISIRAIEESISSFKKHIFLVTQREADIEKPNPEDLYSIGVVSRILQLMRLPDGNIKVLFEGLYRATWDTFENNEQALVSHSFLHDEQDFSPAFGNDTFPCLITNEIQDIDATPIEAEALYRAVHDAIEDFSKVNKKLTPEHVAAISALHHAGKLSDAIMPHLKLDFAKKQEVLETLDTAERLAKAYELLNSELAVADLEKKIKSRVKDQMEKNQREYYLTEQIKAIHKEMGNEDPQAEADELELRIREKNMSDEAKERALRELKKLRPMSPSSAEYSVARNYIDWVLDLPWNELKDIHIDIKEAKNILDNAHFGLEKPKERILEYLAVQKLTDGLKGPILCFVGPPGVGKTSLAKSVAQATGRDFVRISLGGVRDEAEIRGHRRTYVGAMPGKILMALRKAKSNNPLFCLDEIDKMTADFRGDPSSALLEVLDPEQNNTFSDHYLDLDYDLSKVFFITTANTLADIPAPLRDRMEIIELSSYLETEKMSIAKDFLLPKQRKMHGLEEENLSVDDAAMLDIIRSYTREAGVRNLERQIAALCRKTAIKMVENENTSPAVHVRKKDLRTYLGIQKYRFGDKENNAQIGVVAGLAYNMVGGYILYIETAVMPGTGKVLTTGQLGSVMKESAEAAFSYVRSRANLLGLRSDFYKDIDIHIHVPEGATPKDGPSAGITIATSIASALLGIPVLDNVAMTGEITLRGRVLAIGGLREKLLAAKRSNIKTIIIPKDNRKDIEEIPKEITNSLKMKFVSHVDEVLPIAFHMKSTEIFQTNNNNADLLLSLKPQEKSEENSEEN